LRLEVPPPTRPPLRAGPVHRHPSRPGLPAARVRRGLTGTGGQDRAGAQGIPRRGGSDLRQARTDALDPPDILPAAFIRELETLQTQVTPEPWSVIEPAIADRLGRPIGE